MALNLVKNTEQPARLSRPHIEAFRANDLAIRRTREQLDALNNKDRAAAADQALCEATGAQIVTVQQEVDALRADASYSNLPAPDVRKQERELQSLQHLLKKQTDTARAATLIRAKYDIDRQQFNAEITRRAALNPKLLFDALREDCLAPLAQEFFAAEQAMLGVLNRVFAAALAVDILARENNFGQFVQSGNIRDLHIPRPDHPAFNPNPLLPEAALAKRVEYVRQIEKDSASLALELLKE